MLRGYIDHGEYNTNVEFQFRFIIDDKQAFEPASHESWNDAVKFTPDFRVSLMRYGYKKIEMHKMKPTQSNRPLILSQNMDWKGLLLCLFFLWPLPALSHQAGDLYHDALAAVESQNFEQAKSLLEQAIQEFPDFADAHHLFGLVEFQITQQPERAIPALQQAIRLNPKLAQAQYDLALLFIQQGNVQEAQSAVQKALHIYPRFWEARLTLAKLFDQLALTNQAIQEYRTVLTQKPFQEQALYNLASQYMRTEDLDLAHPLLLQLTEHHPQHSDGWYLLGRHAERQNQPIQALQAYQQVIQINPEHSEAHYNLGFIYQQQGEQQKAIEHFQRVTHLKPQDAEAFLNLGVLLAATQHLNEAEQAYQKGIALQPNSTEGHFNLGAFYEFSRKDLLQAQTHYKKYLDLGGKDPRIHQLFNQLENK